MVAEALGHSLELQDPIELLYPGGPLVVPFANVDLVVQFPHAESPRVPGFVVVPGVLNFLSFPKLQPPEDSREVPHLLSSPDPLRVTTQEVLGPVDSPEVLPNTNLCYRIHPGAPPTVDIPGVPDLRTLPTVPSDVEPQEVHYQGSIPGALHHVAFQGLHYHHITPGPQEVLVLTNIRGKFCMVGCQRVRLSIASQEVLCLRDQSPEALQAILVERAQESSISQRVQMAWENQEDYLLH